MLRMAASSCRWVSLPALQPATWRGEEGPPVFTPAPRPAGQRGAAAEVSRYRDTPAFPGCLHCRFESSPCSVERGKNSAGIPSKGGKEGIPSSDHCVPAEE